MTAATVGIFIHYILKVSWLESFLIGSVLSSTDAASVFHILRSRRLDLKDNAASVLELESGSNDPMAYMLTILFASLLSGQVFSIPYMFLCQLGMGLIFGFLLGKVTVWTLHNIPFVIDEGRTIFTVAIMLFLTFIARPIASAVSLLPFGSGWHQLVVISRGGLRGAVSIVKDIFCNHLIKELYFPEDMLAVIVIRKNEKIVPNGETFLKDGDVLVLAGPDFTEGDNFTLQERVLGKGNKWVGKQIQDIRLPQETLIVTVTHGDKTIIPSGDTVLLEDDEIVLAMFCK